MNLKKTVFILLAVTINGCATHRELTDFNENSEQHAKCYNRSQETYTSVVDSHLHYRPFGGASLPFEEVNEYTSELGVKFVNVYGIGQGFPIDSTCEYYLDCPGTPVVPTIKNDFMNAANYLANKPKDVHLTLSMTFADLAHPENIVTKIELLDREFPHVFKWMGEVNLVKQALFNNNHNAATTEQIAEWKDFMGMLEARGTPIAIHSDLGNDAEPTKYLYLMDEVLKRYPNNKIIWVHMGLSKELPSMDPGRHIQLMKSRLDSNPNLMLDISWRVIYDNYFKKPEMRKKYVAFLNKYSDRILPGTDFVASHKKSYAIYKEELEVNSDINKDLNDEAFRNIALGENYFRLLNLGYKAPMVCGASS